VKTYYTVNKHDVTALGVEISAIQCNANLFKFGVKQRGLEKCAVS